MSTFHRRTHFQSDANFCKCGQIFAECTCYGPLKAIQVYQASDGQLTKRFYAELEKRGPAGHVAVNLFRAQKCSTRAKVYRGRRFKNAAYDTKQWAMQNLTAILAKHAEELWIIWGWKQDPSTVFGEQASWVLYVELPRQGQVSFHSPTRGAGPDYASAFDGQHKSAERIIAFCDQVYAQEVAA
jgi:hypothetical protein